MHPRASSSQSRPFVPRLWPRRYLRDSSDPRRGERQPRAGPQHHLRAPEPLPASRS